MKIPALFLLLSITLVQQAYSQVKLKELCVISYDCTGKKVRIDTSIYQLGIEATPFYTIDYWMFMGTKQFPIQYSEFITDRKTDSTTIDTVENGVIKKFYNEFKNEWFVYERRKNISNRKALLWITFYHEYHKTYFTTKTKWKFNKNGYLTSSKTYDWNNKTIENKEVYLYR